MEKPFYVGESIARLNGTEPTLDVEEEIKLVLESKQNPEQVLIQNIKELGLER